MNLEKDDTEMYLSGRIDFCTTCRKETEFSLKKQDISEAIRGKDYTFSITVAICSECGKEMNPPGLIDKNIQEIDEQYREVEGLVTIDDIESLMKIYKLGKAPLSLALGFGEITVTRYLSGQIPSKSHSDIMKKALSSPEYMKECLIRNKNKLSDTAYNRAMEAISQLENLFCLSSKMLRVISYLFDYLEEIAPLMLQKLLYFIQGIYLACYGEPIFVEDCEAWIHGPVYADVYSLFKDFKYNPVDDARFAIVEGSTEQLTNDEKEVIELVTKTFGLYSGKVLEKITNNERPWKKARKGYSDTIPSHEIITKASMGKYYKEVDEEYGITTEAGLSRYIQDMTE